MGLRPIGRGVISTELVGVILAERGFGFELAPSSDEL